MGQLARVVEDPVGEGRNRVARADGRSRQHDQSRRFSKAPIRQPRPKPASIDSTGCLRTSSVPFASATDNVSTALFTVPPDSSAGVGLIVSFIERLLFLNAAAVYGWGG